VLPEWSRPIERDNFAPRHPIGEAPAHLRIMQDTMARALPEMLIMIK
jgi:hypothetical protein